jgi:DNA-binding LacI/PurR family transcriptional regulator
VPRDVAVVGFDDSSVAAQAHPPLTTVRQPVEDMAEAMARLLLAALRQAQEPDDGAAAGGAAAGGSETFVPELVVRASA